MPMFKVLEKSGEIFIEIEPFVDNKIKANFNSAKEVAEKRPSCRFLLLYSSRRA